jgi:energy-coupling factor transport system ATP-binding protein
MQNPGDYFLHDRAGDEVGPGVLERAGLAHLASRHPRDLSGGERQRLALAVVTGGEPPAVLLLDEPTRGMDHARKAALGREVRALALRGTAVVLAPHDAELAVAVARRVVLLGRGEVVADAPTAEVLGGGWYFATQTARVLGGAALDPEAGAALLRHRLDVVVQEQEVVR